MLSFVHRTLGCICISQVRTRTSDKRWPLPCSIMSIAIQSFIFPLSARTSCFASMGLQSSASPSHHNFYQCTTLVPSCYVVLMQPIKFSCTYSWSASCIVTGSKIGVGSMPNRQVLPWPLHESHTRNSIPIVSFSIGYSLLLISKWVRDVAIFLQKFILTVEHAHDIWIGHSY